MTKHTRSRTLVCWTFCIALVCMVCGCHRYVPDCERHYWRFQKTSTGCNCYDSARVYLPPDGPCQSIEAELISGPRGERFYISTVCFQFPPLDCCDHDLSVTFCCAGKQHTFQGFLMEGGQRLLMEDAAHRFLVQQLMTGHQVEIQVGIFQACLTPARFVSAYSRMQKAVR